VSALACGPIIGIEDHRFVADAAVADTAQACERYCDDVLKNCGGDAVQAFRQNDRSDCLAWCSHLPPGKRPDETSGNSVSCRAHYAREASGEERDVMFCPAAAPGGGSREGEASCGTNCDAYCGVYEQVCPESADDECTSRCPGIPDRQAFSSGSDFSAGDDTIQCRLAHLTAASRAKFDAEAAQDSDVRKRNEDYRKLHCGHAKLRPDLNANDMPCDLKASKAPNCADYCQLVQTACTASNQVYDDTNQCLRVCEKAFPAPAGVPMNMPDTTEDTLWCRRWHAYFALTDEPRTHCGHAGPSGTGHCGKPCPVYCSLLQSACRMKFTSTFSSQAQCEAACEGLPGVDGGYSIAAEITRTDSYQCRIHKIAEVLGSSGSGTGTGMAACNGAFPADECRP